MSSARFPREATINLLHQVISISEYLAQLSESYDCDHAQPYCPYRRTRRRTANLPCGVFTEPREATGKCSASTDPWRRKGALSRTQDETRHTKIWTYILPASLVGQALPKLKGKVFVISYRLSFYHS